MTEEQEAQHEKQNIDPEKIKFFQENKTEIGEMIEKENIKRERQGASLITEENIDTAVTAMMDIVAKGGVIKQFRFRDVAPLQFPSKPAQQAIPPNIPQKSGKHFSVIDGENGYILTSGENFYIFKSDKELLSILRKIIFEKEGEK